MNTKPQNGSYKDFLNGDTVGKNFKFKLIEENKSTSMVNSKGVPVRYVGSCRIEASGLITEKNEAGMTVQRSIRYIQGESEIYKDRQSNDKDIPKRKYFIEFVNGLKTISGTNDSLLLTYMMKDNLNASNKNRRTNVIPKYELVDNAQIIETSMANDKALDEAKYFCREGKIEIIEMYARFLNVNINQKIEEIRWDLRTIAMRNPTKFLSDLASPTMEKKYRVLQALDMGFLIIQPMNNSIAWATNQNQPLDIAPVGKDIVDSFVNKLGTDDGKLIYNALLEMVSPGEKVQVKMVVPTKAEIDQLKMSITPAAPILHNVDESDNDLYAMLEKGIAKGIVALKKPFWLEYRGVNFKKKEGFINGLKNNPEMLIKFKEDLVA